MNTQLPSVLCVDDDPSVLEFLNDFLTGQGFEVITASNGVEAFLQVKQCKPQVVIMTFSCRSWAVSALSGA
jgi:two-component system alkaline phosphatase synthesis response regulator PhoP